MNTVLYFSSHGAVYETSAYAEADIHRLVRDQGLQSLTSADRQFDFWFSPATPGCQRRANLGATELLLATTRFTSKTVPLLRGCVVVATHDGDGQLDGLSWRQLDVLTQRIRALTTRDKRALGKRIFRDNRTLAAQQAARQAAKKAVAETTVAPVTAAPVTAAPATAMPKAGPARPRPLVEH